MLTLDHFTPEIQKKIKEYKKKCTEDLYSGKEYQEYDPKNTKEYISMLYSFCNFEEPRIIIADNILEYKILFNLLLNSELDSELDSQLNSKLDSQLNSKLKSELNSQLNSKLKSELYSELDSELYSELYSELNSKLDSELGSELDSKLYSKLHSKLDSELDSKLDSELYSKLYSELYSELDSELYSELYSKLDSKLDSELVQAKYHYFFLSSEYTRVYLTWYKFIKDEFNIPCSKGDILDDLYDLVFKASIAKAFFTKKWVLVLRMPSSISFQNRLLHNIDGPALCYPNMERYYVRGIKLEKEMFYSIKNKTFTFKDFQEQKNEELKSAILFLIQECFGNEGLYDFLTSVLRKEDVYIDKKDPSLLINTIGMNVGVYTLYKGSVDKLGNIAFIQCFCPSTDRVFMLGVEPHHTKAKDAIASLCRIRKSFVPHIVSIQRQGEIFSVNYDEEYTKKLKSGNYNKNEEKVGLDGETYFTKIKFEY